MPVNLTSTESTTNPVRSSFRSSIRTGSRPASAQERSFSPTPNIAIGLPGSFLLHYLSARTYDYVINSSSNNFIEWAAATTTAPVVVFTGGGVNDLTVSSVTFVSSGTLRATFSISHSITGGPYNIIETNPGGQSTSEFSNLLSYPSRSRRLS